MQQVLHELPGMLWPVQTEPSQLHVSTDEYELPLRSLHETSDAVRTRGVWTQHLKGR
jgi:hypothetical protein